MSGGQDEASDDIESSGDLPSFAELLEMPSEPCLWFEEDEDAKDAHDAKAAMMSCVGGNPKGGLPYDEVLEQIEMLDPTWGKMRPNWPNEKENDVEEELDLSKPCEVRTDDTGGEWTPTLREPFFPKYEPHTMESLLPLVKEWVHHKHDDKTIQPILGISPRAVLIGRSIVDYKTLESFVWATGPHAGKPVAREVK